MSLPAVVFSLVVASLYAGVFHFLLARRAAELLYYWGAAIVGFLLGAVLGLIVPWDFLMIGEVHLFEGTVVCAAALFLARWLQSSRAN